MVEAKDFFFFWWGRGKIGWREGKEGRGGQSKRQEKERKADEREIGDRSKRKVKETKGEEGKEGKRGGETKIPLPSLTSSETLTRPFIKIQMKSLRQCDFITVTVCVV